MSTTERTVAWSIIAATSLLIALGSPGLTAEDGPAAPAGGITLSRGVVGGGGGDSSNSALTIRGTAGQADAGLQKGTQHALYGGFWFRAVVVQRGDCNADRALNAGDMSALTLEVFDGDGMLAGSVPGSTYAGDPVGCDANADGEVGAADVACLVLMVFGGLAACG